MGKPRADGSLRTATMVIAGLLGLSAVLACPAQAGWQDLLKGVQQASGISGHSESGSSGGAQAAGLAALSNSETVQGLKQTLGNAVESSVRQLGKSGGYLNKANVRIPLPDTLARTEKLLRQAGQGQRVDDFVKSMNSAAEHAVVDAAPILGDAVRDLSFEDAKGILTGGDRAATEYLQRVSKGPLLAKFRPVVEQSMSRSGVTRYYKQLMAKAGGSGQQLMGLASQFLGKDVTDIDAYVTEKTLDGLFTTLGEQEAAIRSNPARWGTDVLKKVLGSVPKRLP